MSQSPRSTVPASGWFALLALAGATACQQAPPATSPPTASQAGQPEVVARVGDTTITLEEVDEVAMAAGIRPFQALYELRRSALDNVVADHLLEQAAASRGTTKEELFENEVTRKAEPVQAEEVQAFYRQNQNRMRGRSLSDVEGQIRQYLENQKILEARQGFVEELKKEIAVETFLPPPRAPVKVAANDPSWGPEDAKVTIVEFSDFQ